MDSLRRLPPAIPEKLTVIWIPLLAYIYRGGRVIEPRTCTRFASTRNAVIVVRRYCVALNIISCFLVQILVALSWVVSGKYPFELIVFQDRIHIAGLQLSRTVWAQVQHEGSDKSQGLEEVNPKQMAIYRQNSALSYLHDQYCLPRKEALIITHQAEFPNSDVGVWRGGQPDVEKSVDDMKPC